MSNYTFLFKLVVVGDSGTGKSCIVSVLVDNKFRDQHDMTIGVEFGSKILAVGERTIKLQIWDTSGNENFKAITRSYYRGSIGIMLIYQISNRNSFNNISQWLKEVRTNSHDNITLFLIGNKSDLQSTREVSYDEGLDFAKENGLHFMECSAKLGQNIDSIFLQISEVILSKIDRGQIDLKGQNMGIKQGVTNDRR